MSRFGAALVCAGLLLRGSVVAAQELPRPGPLAEPTTAPGVVVTGAASPGADTLRYPPSTVRLPLVLGGLAFTAASYGGAAAMGAAFGDAEVPGADSLYIPLVGPFIALGQIGCSPNEPESCGELNALRGFLYILDGLAQIGGLGIAAEGIFATTEAAPRAGGVGLELRPVPIVTGEVRGIGLLGRF
jgi:hypothetical protein